MEEGCSGPKLLHWKLLLTGGCKQQSSHLLGYSQYHRDAQRVVQEAVILLQPCLPRATGLCHPIFERHCAPDRVPAYLSPLQGSAIFMNITRNVGFRCLPPRSLHLSLFFPSPSYLFFLLLLLLPFFSSPVLFN